MQIIKEKIRKIFRKKSVKKLSIAFFMATVVVAMIISLLPQEVAYAAEKKADQDTTDTYKASLGNDTSTQYAGRIWTDKTVYSENSVTLDGIEVTNDSDFLVAYSALSTSQAISGQTQAPIDVVFIIDMSSSMYDNLSGLYSTQDDSYYTRAYRTIQALNTSIEKLMALNENTRVGVVAFGNIAYDILPLGHYEKFDQNEPYFSITSEGYQFPAENEGERETIDLKVNARDISSRQPYIEVTTISSGTNIHMGFYTGMNMLATEQSTKATIDGKEVQRVPAVVALSDGAPNYSSSSESWWQPENNSEGGKGSSHFVFGQAMKAMATASYMKKAIDKHYSVTDTMFKTTMYTIGMGMSNLGGISRQSANIVIDPEHHWDENTEEWHIAELIRNAWAEYSNGESPVLQVGKRLSSPYYPNSDMQYTMIHPDKENDITSINAYVDHYYGADQADDVTNVFDDIVSNISISTPSVPTEIQGANDPTQDGFITYTDPIGEYMEVKDVKAIIYNGTQYENHAYNEDTQTYSFVGTVDSPIYGQQKLSDIIITVQDDVLEIKIPAALIPIRINTISLDKDGNVKSNVSNNKNPIRVLYTVGLKKSVKNEDGTVSQKVDATYLQNHTNLDGTVSFYSNYFDGSNKSSTDKTAGNAKVEFKSSSTNPYYFMQENTLLYLDEDCTIPADANTELDPYSTYYFKNQYYEGNSLITTTVGRLGSAFSYAAIINVRGQWAIKAGRPRLGNLTDFTNVKTNGLPNTAETSYAPVFVYAEGDTERDPANGHFVVYLGNNGELKLPAYGDLAITKAVVSQEGITAPDTDFQFKVSLKNGGNDLEGEFTYKVVSADNDNPVKDKNVNNITGKVSNNGTISLKDGQKAIIEHLPVGTEYTISEEPVPGFTTTSQNDIGTITPNTTQTAAFTNTYRVKPVDLENKISVKKILEGRDWTDKDEFIFEISSTDLTDPLPEPNQIKVTNAQESFFGKITYTKPGTYTYTIVEKTPSQTDKLPGLAYSDAAYNIVVKVEPMPNSVTNEVELKITDFKMYKTSNDDGSKIEESKIPVVELATFTNVYAEDGQVSLLATKQLNDQTGQKALINDMFQFRLKPTGENAVEAPRPANIQANESGEYIVTNVGHSISFGQLTFTQEMIGKTYLYEISEVVPDTNPYQGMSYDTYKYIAKVEVTSKTVDGKTVVVPEVTYMDEKNTDVGRITFVNTYDPQDVTIALKGTKTLTGRDMKEDETFDFELELKSAVNNKLEDISSTVRLNDSQKNASVSKGKNGVSSDFTFDDITLSRPGTYVFGIKEKPGNANNGVTYDTHECEVKVVVEDVNGVLKASTTYDNGLSATDNAQAIFKNVYKPVFDTSTTININGTKTLVGKPLGSNDFAFIVENVDNAPMGQSSNTNYNSAGSQASESSDTYVGNITLLKDITYDKAGIYTYVISEKVPESGQSKGMSYDSTKYKVIVTVEDDFNGKLKASYEILMSTDNGNTYGASHDGINFTNTYVPEPYIYSPIQITKVLAGHRSSALEAGEFEFKISVIEADHQDGIFLPEKTIVTNEKDGSVKFGNIKFTKAGTYKVQIEEVIPQNTDTENHIIYDSHKIISTFSVTDQNGTLVAVRTGVSSGHIYTNIYDEQIKTVYNQNNEDIDGKSVNVGDILTYNIDWVNSAVNSETGSPTGATITITDKIPTGTSYVEGSAGSGTVKDGMITWTIDATAAQSGTVSFKVKVDKDAIEYDQIQNKATVKIGENGPQVETNNVTNYVPKPLVISKTIHLTDGQNTKIDTEKLFTFTIMLTDEYNKALTGRYHYDVINVQDDSVVSNGTVSNGDSLKLKHHQKAIIYNLPVGTKYEVEETDEPGYTADAKNKSGEISLTSLANVAFINTYNATMTKDIDTSNRFTKEFVGRAWTENDYFEFILKPDDPSYPMPLDANGKINNCVTVGKPETGNSVDFGFGTIHFKEVGEYTYTITENVTDKNRIPGVKYDTHEAKMTIHVKDQGDGQLVLDTAITSIVTGEKFTNRYVELDYTAMGGLVLEKTLNGRDMMVGQFKFVIEPTNDISASKLDLKTGKNEFESVAAEDGTTITIKPLDNKVIKFTQDDVGKTYSYRVWEEEPDSHPGYEYDTAVRTVTIETIDNNDHTLTIKTTVHDGKNDVVYNYTTGQSDYMHAVIPFSNSYTASGSTIVSTIKRLNGRELNNGEFHFQVIAQKNPEIVIVDDVTNDKDGYVNFGKFQYSIESLKQMVKDGYAVKKSTNEWVVSYTAVEKTDGFTENGLTATKGSFDFTVTVIDNGDGTLTATVNMPENSGFINTYATNTLSVNINGSKKLSVAEGLTPPDIEGKYTFTISSDDENAPLPEKTTTVNDALGNIDFGSIKFTLNNVLFDTENSDEGNVRTKTFTYKVSEKGSVAGIKNDVDKTFTLTVADDGRGNLSVSKNPEKELLFTFVNTYGIVPTSSSVSDQISIFKVLEGRNLVNNEFEFVLQEGNKIVAKGTNDVKGNVIFDAIEYTEPGVHIYDVYEVDGADSNGITYDAKHYTIHTTVKDNGDGTLSVTHSALTEDGNIVFNNKYEASFTSVTLGASKILKGRNLAENEFIFQLKDKDGRVVAEAKNDANGQVIFKTLKYDSAGIYEYTIVEVNDSQKNITYDSAEYKITVTVADDGSGYLKAKVTGDAAVFTNTYTKPEAPTPEGSDPEKPTTTPEQVPTTQPESTSKDDNNQPNITDTSDHSNIIGYTSMMLISCFGIIISLIEKRKMLMKK